MAEPVQLILIPLTSVAVAVFCLFFTIFRGGSAELRKARAFLHFRSYENRTWAIAVGLVVATLLLFVSIARDPESVEWAPDFAIYFPAQMIVSGALLYTWANVRKRGESEKREK